MTDTSEESIPSGPESVAESTGKPPELAPKPQTTPQPQVSAPAQKQRIGIIPKISLTLGIISLTLVVLGQLGILKDLILATPILEPPRVDETSPFSQPFGIRSGMSFFTMHDRCVKAAVESEIYDQDKGIIKGVISGDLNDIGAGKVNYLEMISAFTAGQSQPI